MQKKILSLILSGVLLSQISYFGTFTFSTYGFKTGTYTERVDLCKNFPKNQYNQTVNTNCAFWQLMADQRVTNGASSEAVKQIGPNGDHELCFWHVDQLKSFADELVESISLRNRESERSNYIKKLTNTAKSFLSLNSTDEAASITNRLLAKFPFFRPKGATSSDVAKWKENASPTLRVDSNDIETWKTEHEQMVEKYKNDLCWWFNRKSTCEEKVNKAIAKELNHDARDQEIKSNVETSTLYQAICAMARGDFEGKDTLVAEKDFSDNNYKAKVYFTNIGLKNQNINRKIIQPLLDQVDYNNNQIDYKEEL